MRTPDWLFVDLDAMDSANRNSLRIAPMKKIFFFFYFKGPQHTGSLVTQQVVLWAGKNKTKQ